MSSVVTFQAIIYRDVKFASDGGGRVTLEFPASEETEIVKLLSMRGQVVRVYVSTEPGAEG